MVLRLERLSSNFLDYLIKIIQDYVITHIDYRKFFRIHVFLVDVMFKGRQYSMPDIITILLYNITYVQYADYSIIRFNPNECLYGTDVKMIDVARLITYGNLFVKGNNIFIDAFTYVATYLDQLKEEFSNGGI